MVADADGTDDDRPMDVRSLYPGVCMSCSKGIRMGGKGRSWGRQGISGERENRGRYRDNWIWGKIRVTMEIKEFRIRWKVFRSLMVYGRCHFASELGHSWTGMAVWWWMFKEGFCGSGRLATKDGMEEKIPVPERFHDAGVVMFLKMIIMDSTVSSSSWMIVEARTGRGDFMVEVLFCSRIR